MYFKKTVLIFVCICLSDVNSEADGPEAAPSKGRKTNENEARMNGPNFSADFPQFTPFRSEEIFQQAFDIPKLDKEFQKSANLSAFESDADKLNYDERIKPWKNFVMGLYQNYRSALANQTLSLNEKPILSSNTLKSDNKTAIKRKKKKKKHNKSAVTDLKFNIGPGVNVSLDKSSEMVSVYLDEDCLKDVFTGRGKKHDLITKILPLFILPFLLQSAVLPFMVSTLKLLLIKSILAGKIAIFLLIVSALKNHSQGYVKSSYEPAPYYVEPPSRRSESADGYRVEGKPTTWIT